MGKLKYVRIPLSIFPPDIIEQYKLQKLVTKGAYVYIHIKNYIYHQTSSNAIVYNQLVNHLKPWDTNP